MTLHQVKSSHRSRDDAHHNCLPFIPGATTLKELYDHAGFLHDKVPYKKVAMQYVMIQKTIIGYGGYANADRYILSYFLITINSIQIKFAENNLH